MDSDGSTVLFPPPVAPPLRPNTGPMLGWRNASATERPLFLSPCARPMEMVVLPLPAGVGVMAETKINLPRCGLPSSARSEIFALSRCHAKSGDRRECQVPALWMRYPRVMPCAMKADEAGKERGFPILMRRTSALRGGSLDSDNHGVRPDEMFHAALLESGFFHPADAFRTSVVESAGSLDEHVEAHQ